jgi:altronate dehydratase large subunit
MERKGETMEIQLEGFKRPDGGIGIRNYIAIIAVMDNSSPTVRRIASAVQGAIALAPGAGRGLMGEDWEQHVRTLIGLGTNPNIAGAVVVSLEPESANMVAQGIEKTGRPVAVISLQDAGGTVKAAQAGISAASAMAAATYRAQRVPLPWSELVVGLECGGSDGSSGIVSNPAVGIVADRLVARGATVIMSEPIEIVGGEHLLARRARNDEVAGRLYDAVKKCVNYSQEVGIDPFKANPGPDNIAGGLSTIEEKALGAIKKGGSTVLNEVIGHSVRPTEKGLVFMDAPAAAVENLTALAAGGTHLILFSTGRGNPIGNPVAPTIKLTGNPFTVKIMRDNIDVDLSAVMTEGLSLDGAADLIDAEIVAVCQGKSTCTDRLGVVEVAISRTLRTL